MINKEIAKIFREMADLLDIMGEKIPQRIFAYRKAADYLDKLGGDVADTYKEKGLKGLLVPRTIGEKNAKKIEEYILKGRIKEYEELKEESAIRQIVTHFFKTKGLGLQELKKNAKMRKIVYSRYTKPAKQLLDLAGGIEQAKAAIDKVAAWANSRKLDYTIETVFKKWLELDRLKPKEIVKKPFYKGLPMIFNEQKKKWFVIKDGEWLEFADKENTIEWKVIE
ncbi:MAG TPA: helix-hairpin-helix domain-containing protein [Candidatus Staskawiczbacteria bacterium]|nr:helix-hairpin-helix domain-containing protein [Candidatus Staskawiczbacteria bacterium]